MKKFRFHVLLKHNSSNSKTITSNWFTIRDIEQLEQWYRVNIEHIQYQSIDIEYQDGTIINLHNIETFFTVA